MERAEGRHRDGSWSSTVDPCAGKTTLARALQSALPDPWLLLGIDLLIWTLPPEMVDDPDGLSFRDGVITRGDAFRRSTPASGCAVAALARSGVNVLLDDVMLDGSADQRRWDEVLSGLDVCWIGVRCPPECGRDPGGRADEPAAGYRPASGRDGAPGRAIRPRSRLGHHGPGSGDRRHRRTTSGRGGPFEVSPNFNRISPLPLAPAWTPGRSLRPPSWER